MDVLKIYNELLKIYGRQGWWPLYVEEGSSLDKNKYRKSFGLTYNISYSALEKFRTQFRDPYFEIVVGAILTQNTAWKNVATAIQNLYYAKALTPSRLLNTPTVQLQKLIKPAGYFRQKVKKLKLFSRWVLDTYKGDLIKLQKINISTVRFKLLEQWGIGDETADSILLYALNKRTFVVDTYTKRLCKKHNLQFTKYDQYREFFESVFPKRTALYQEFHALIVEWGKNNRAGL